MRLDLYLYNNGHASSRTEAKRYVEGGAVTVNGKYITKPAFDVSEADAIEVDSSIFRYVSRGGIKLAGALDEFGIDVAGKICLDIGASSGGFTDCLLQNGAKHVIAVDSGRDQLVEKIRTDNRVTSIEGYNARYMVKADFPFKPTVAVMDVSFISATYIIKPLAKVLPAGADFICLIKPQFEVGRSNISKGGIVKDEKARMGAVKKVTEFALSVGFTTLKVIESPIKGGDGNIEFLAHFKRI